MAWHEHVPGCAGCSSIDTTVDPKTIPDGIARRTFLIQSAIIAASAALAACAGSDNGFTSPNINGSATVKVSDYPALANVGGVATVNAGGAPLAVVRTGTSSFLALSRVCPHQGSIVNVGGPGFVCPNHGAEFSTTGQWVGGQRTSSLHSYATSYDATTGTLTIS